MHYLHKVHTHPLLIRDNTYFRYLNLDTARAELWNKTPDVCPWGSGRSGCGMLLTGSASSRSGCSRWFTITWNPVQDVAYVIQRKCIRVHNGEHVRIETRTKLLRKCCSLAWGNVRSGGVLKRVWRWPKLPTAWRVSCIGCIYKGCSSIFFCEMMSLPRVWWAE